MIRWNCDLRVINARKKRHFLSYWKRRHDAQITSPYAYYVTLGSRCKMATRAPKMKLMLCPRDPQGYSCISLSLPGRIWKITGIPRGLWNCTHWSPCYTNGRDAGSGAARKSARLNCINLIHFRLTVGQLCGSSCIIIPGVVGELLQFAATQ